MSNKIKLKLKLKWFFVLVLIFLAHSFVLAKECYVDKAEGSGDGSKNKPYKTIEKALDKKCDRIKVAKGTYGGKIILSSGVEIEGRGNKTVIDGRVVMKDKTKLQNLYVKNEGITVVTDANVKISKVQVTGANIGIKTEGGGKLTLENSVMKHNVKGLYLRYGTKIDLRNNTVTHNDGEGVDIRANVDGIIKNNLIDSNKEGGIEVIIGKSQLSILNNSLKHNKASGIALQFYRESSKLGDIKISGNTLIGNGNYAIDCKRPSGGHPMKKYWSKSVTFAYNNISGNGKGEISQACEFDKSELEKAQKTAKEIANDKQKNKQKKDGQENDDKNTEKTEADKKQQEEQIKEEARRVMEQQKRIDLELKDKIEQKMPNYKKECRYSNNDKEIFSQHKKWQVFLFGPSEEVVTRMENRITKCSEAKQHLQNKTQKIKTVKIKKEIESGDLAMLNKKQQEFEQALNNYKNKFGILKWLKKLFHYQD